MVVDPSIPTGGLERPRIDSLETTIASLSSPVPSEDSMTGLRGLVALALVASVVCKAAVKVQEPEDPQAAAAAAHEAQAQQALADSLTDAMAMLKHGSASAKEQAAMGVAQLAVETTISQPFHPVTFRNACVRMGVVEELARLLAASPPSVTVRAQLHALAALEAIATDDPSTDLDNGHALAVCSANAVGPLVAHLSSSDESVQLAAASCAAVLAENPACQTKLLTQGAVSPLVALGTFGTDVARMHAVAALDLLALNNPAAHDVIAQAGGLKLLKGLKRFGGQHLRGAAGGMLSALSAPAETLAVAVDAKAHATQAHEARLKHSKILEGAMPVRRAYAPGVQPS